MAGTPTVPDHPPAALVATPAEDWTDALTRAGWPAIQAGAGDAPSILLLVDLVTAPAADIEALIDALIALGAGAVQVAASADSSAKVAANRDVYALADIAGYRYTTDAGHDYDIVDLGEDLRDEVFSFGSALHGTPASAIWTDAPLKIVHARAATGGAGGYSGALDALIGALPLADKDMHYRLRRDPGEVAATLLQHTPPDLAIVEGPGIRIAGASPLAADFAAAAKLGLDPFEVPALARAARVFGQGDLAVAGDLAPVTSARGRAATPAGQTTNEAVSRLARGWSTPMDRTSFPFLSPLDAQVTRLLGPRGEASGGIQPVLGALMGMAARATDAWQTLFAKDALVQRTVALDLDPFAISPEQFEQMVAELEALTPLATSAREHAEGLRWRKWERAVLFAFERTLAIPFDRFVQAVDVSHTIGFMNDYLGGVIVVAERDDQGRPVRQAERNLYLPQPNWIALYGGKPIDVSKIEVVRYGADEHRLYWKTLHSANGSAEADDGYVSFRREGAGTHVTIVGKQLFVLPPLLQLLDLSLVPAIEDALTTMAYSQFFDRTLNNFEALVEGRDVRLGRDPADETEHPSVTLEAAFGRLATRAAPIIEQWQAKVAPLPAPDADGFVHVTPGR